MSSSQSKSFFGKALLVHGADEVCIFRGWGEHNHNGCSGKRNNLQILIHSCKCFVENGVRQSNSVDSVVVNVKSLHRNDEFLLLLSDTTLFLHAVPAENETSKHTKTLRQATQVSQIRNSTGLIRRRSHCSRQSFVNSYNSYFSVNRAQNDTSKQLKGTTKNIRTATETQKNLASEKSDDDGWGPETIRYNPSVENDNVLSAPFQ